MIDSQRNPYYNSKEWKRKREEALKRADYRCQLCNYAQEDWSTWLEVHHRTYQGFKNEQPEDLTVLCQECHWLFHKTHYYTGSEFAGLRRRFQAIAKWRN